MKLLILLLFFVGAALTLRAQPAGDTVQINVPGLVLKGTLTVPANQRQPMPVVLLIAGSGATDRDGNTGTLITANSYRQLADSLLRRGVAVLRYDKRGVGASKVTDRSLLNRSFDDIMQDAVACIRYLEADKRFSRVVVAGHSEGSLLGMLAAQETKAAGFISIAGAGRTITEILKVQLNAIPDSLRTIAYNDLDSLHAGQTVQRPPKALMQLFHPQIQPYLMSWMKYDPAVVLKAYAGPVLIIQGKHDIQVAVSEAELLKAARPDAKLVLFEDMNHGLKNAPADRTANIATYTQPALPLTPGLAAVIADFAKKLR